MVARKSNCAFNTVRVSSTGRPWIVDNDSRGGDDEHAQPNAELAIELTGQTRAAHKVQPPHHKTDNPLSALLCATFTTEEAAAAAEAAAAVKAAVEAGKKQRLEAATAAKLRGEPFAECSWREGGRQHEDARRARASLDAHRAAAAQMNETRQWQLRVAAARKAAESAWWQQAGLFDACGLKRKEAPPPAAAAEVEKASPPATLVVLLAQRPRLHGLIPRGDACRAIGAEQRERIARMLCKGSDELLKLNTHTIPASGSPIFKARRVCGSNGGHNPLGVSSCFYSIWIDR